MVRDMMGTYSSSGGCGGGDMNEKPAWLERLMAETFFGGCGVHEHRRKNEKNVFCLHCCLSICPHCLSSHRSHPLLQLSFLLMSFSKSLKGMYVQMQFSHLCLQVRRYVYHDVIRLDDLEKLIDCSNIQPYTINSAKVIFLNQRPQSRTCKGPANACFTCDRILQEPFHFCSLSCKVDYMVYAGQRLSSILHRFDESDFAISKFESLRVDGSEVTDEDIQLAPSCSYSNTEATSNSVISLEPNSNVKKDKNNRFLPGIVLSLGGSRRKGAPQRAPLS
ncbi:hypothetical protein Fmac_008121 [Flemingia macrophylla]|uniref:PLATZ transcription factor family protein n=1 Tax=Flemingia macrophylla TaxID=520843 RepID=A0ABD1MWI6_9FABA